MRRLITLAVLAAIAIAEVAVVLWLSETVGWALTVAILMADMFVGVVVARTSGAVMSQVLKGSQDPSQARWGDAAIRFLAGLIIALPGLVTSVLALPLLIPGVRRAVARWLAPRIEASAMESMSRTGAAPGTFLNHDVIVGEVIHTDPDGDSPAGPAPGPDMTKPRPQIEDGAP